MAANAFRAEALKIWQAISNGLLEEECDPPSLQYVEALDFLRKVAKNLLAADAKPSGSRADAIVSAVRLTGKVSKFEEDIYRIIVLIEDFYPTNLRGTKRSRNSAVAHYMMNWAENVESSELSEFILMRGHNELMKVIQQVREKRPFDRNSV
jgi:hypothetical protein